MSSLELYEFWHKTAKLTPTVAQSHVTKCLDFEGIDLSLIQDLYLIFYGDRANGYRVAKHVAIHYIYHSLQNGIRDAQVIIDLFDLFLTVGGTKQQALKELWRYIGEGVHDVQLIEHWFQILNKIGFTKNLTRRMLRKYALDIKLNSYPNEFFEHYKFWIQHKGMTKKNALDCAAESIGSLEVNEYVEADDDTKATFNEGNEVGSFRNIHAKSEERSRSPQEKKVVDKSARSRTYSVSISTDPTNSSVSNISVSTPSTKTSASHCSTSTVNSYPYPTITGHQISLTPPSLAAYYQPSLIYNPTPWNLVLPAQIGVPNFGYPPQNTYPQFLPLYL